MRWLIAGAAAVLVLSGLAGASAVQASIVGEGPQVSVWTDRGEGGVYRVGDLAALHIQPAEDCYVIVYEIDTDGYLRVLYPRDCDDDGYLVGGRTYSMGREGSHRFYVNGPSGVEYVHVLASFEPFRQIYWHGCNGYEDYAIDVTWRGFNDYWGSALPPRVYGDPYVAMQTIDEFICLDALEAGMVWADFTYFYVNERVRYPRYLCYDCHGFAPLVRPYDDVCVGFSVSFVDCDPGYRPWSWWWWSSPTRVYCGPRYVCHTTGHQCDDSCRGRHGSGHGWAGVGGTYPSEYKWKSRVESHGIQALETMRGRAAESGNTTGALRVKSKVNAREQTLYSRRGSGSSEDRETRARETWQRESAGRTSVRSVESEPRGDTGKSKVDVRVERPKRERSSAEGHSILRSLLEDTKATRSDAGSDRKSEVKSDRSRGKSSTEKTKGVIPQVRRGDKGKSQSARRTLSK
ncbi:MAG: DUF4384 domain-containing protein [Candidatus Eisenbacteria bacterium]